MDPSVDPDYAMHIEDFLDSGLLQQAGSDDHSVVYYHALAVEKEGDFRHAFNLNHENNGAFKTYVVLEYLSSGA